MISNEQIHILDSILLGILQGVTEWLPVSSEGIVSVTYSLLLERPFSEAVAFALWLHIGTAFSAAVAFRKEITALLRGILSKPPQTTRLLTYLIVSSVLSGLIGLPILIFLGNIQESFGITSMGIVGAMMLVTGGVLIRKSSSGYRNVNAVSAIDGVIAGTAQGIAALPGLSRSGLTISILLARQVNHKTALTLSFLMSIPASLGSAIYIGYSEQITMSLETIVASLVSFTVGLLTIKTILAIAQRINTGAFVLCAGSAMILGSILLHI